MLNGRKQSVMISKAKILKEKKNRSYKCYECIYYESLRKGSYLCNHERESYARLKLCPILRSNKTKGWACNEFVSTPGAKEERRKREEHAKKDRKALGSYYKEGKNKAMPTMSIAEYLQQQKKGS